jgi:broad specificity phosphatase PhoE
MTIYLIRHGLALAGAEDLDPGLAPLGHEQAEAAARALRDVRALRLVVSPLRRTRETAAPIARALGLEAESRDEVAEVFDPAMPPEERRQMIGPFMAGKWADQPAHLQAWRRRAVDAVLELALEAESHTRDLVVVSHYIAIGAVIGEAMGDDRVVPQPMANASITSFNLVHGSLTLIAAAATGHLAPEQVTGIHSAMAGRG